MNLSIAHINIRSLVANFNQFRDQVTKYNFDIIGVTETWMSTAINSDVIKIDQYNFIRQDRPMRGGGVGMYIKNNLKFSLLVSECCDFVEYIWLKVRVNKQELAVGTVYRPPNSNIMSFFNNFEDILTGIYSNFNNVICCGDFNINLLNINSNICTQFNSILETFNLKQLINEPTRITNTTTSILDLIFVNFENNSEECEAGVEDVQISDHFLVYCKINHGSQKSVPQNISYRALKNIDFNNFQNDLESMPWNLYHRKH